MKYSLLKKKVDDVETQIFNCNRCKELFELRIKKEHNCPVLGFDVQHYLNSRVCSICEAPGIYKPHKGEILIEKLEDFHRIYDDRIQNIALIGQRLMSIYTKANLQWTDIQHFNAVCCSPPNYRQPTTDEFANCLPFLKLRIDMMQNLKVIITFGKIARSALTQFKFNVPVIKSHHPSYLYAYMSELEREQYEINVSKQLICALK